MAYFGLASGKRGTWQIEVDAARLHDACKERIAYHLGRVDFWDKAQKQAETNLREGGISIKHYDVTGGHRSEAQLDPSLAKRVAECQSKLDSNKDSVHRFQAYLAFFSLAIAKFELTADDVLYFNLLNADTEGERT